MATITIEDAGHAKEKADAAQLRAALKTSPELATRLVAAMKDTALTAGLELSDSFWESIVPASKFELEQSAVHVIL